MSDMPHAQAIAVAAAAHSAWSAAQGGHTLAHRRRLDEEQALRDDEVKRARLMELEDEDRALRHLDRDEAVPTKPQRVKTLATLNDKIPRRKAAIPILKQREAEAARGAEAAQVPLTAAIIEAVSMVQQPAVERVQMILAGLEEPLRDLLMADMIQLGTIGDRFSVPAGQAPPFSGATVVHKFLSAIPTRLLPPELATDRIDAGARAASVAIIRQIKESRS